ncbi:MAG: ATP-binding protein [Deltaproteobacteria bacterium]
MKALRFTLHVKLALIALLLLAVPLIGFWHTAAMSSFLFERQEEGLAHTAKAIATILHDCPELFAANVLPAETAGRTVDAYLLQKPIQVDGNTDDWGGLLQEAAGYGQQNILEEKDIYDPQSLSFKFLGGRYENSLYFLFIVKDDHVVFREKYSSRIDKCDHLLIALENEGGLLDYYVVSATQSGGVNACLLLGGPDNYRSTISEKRIQGFWKQTRGGYIIEMRIPLRLMGDRVSFALADVDDPVSREVQMVIGTGGVKRAEELGILLAKSPELDTLLKALQRPATKIWVVDQQKRVRSIIGNLEVARQGPSFMDSIRPLVRFFRLQQGNLFSSRQPVASEFNLDRLQEVLAGKAFIARRAAGEQGGQIVAAAEPLWIGKEIRGAVVVEQSFETILATRKRMMEHLSVATALVFLIVIAVLLLFASRLSGRIRCLRSQTDRAIAQDGRIVGSFAPLAGSDELGDLSRHLASTINRLQQYHLHQEKMADHLEHEMRTPLAGVSASLTNLSRQLGEGHPAAQEYLLDARKNLQRLEGILTGIREAATIKEALRQDEQEKFDLCAAVRTWVESYRKMFDKVRFSFQAPEESIHIMADPNRIFQMMDKLVENAVDFSPAGATVGLRLEQDRENAVIAVLNEGPQLDESRADQLFHSMVSERSSRNDEKNHMGLGLFIVRSIVEFNGGQVKAANRTDGGKGAVFTVKLPKHSWVKDISIQK